MVCFTDCAHVNTIAAIVDVIKRVTTTAKTSVASAIEIVEWLVAITVARIA